MSAVTSERLEGDFAAETGRQTVFEIKPLDLPKGMARRGHIDSMNLCWDGAGDSEILCWEGTGDWDGIAG